jgi:hypothetical protein
MGDFPDRGKAISTDKYTASSNGKWRRDEIRTKTVHPYER